LYGCVGFAGGGGGRARNVPPLVMWSSVVLWSEVT